MGRLAASRTESKTMFERAPIILGCLDGRPVNEIARQGRTRPSTVIKWRQRFVLAWPRGLRDAPRPGARRRHDEAFRKRILAMLERFPPAGQAGWDISAVARGVRDSVHVVWRELRREGICLQRQRSWCVSTGPEYVAKAAVMLTTFLDFLGPTPRYAFIQGRVPRARPELAFAVTVIPYFLLTSA
jgi:transposase